ncbi:Pre (Mob) type recombination enzyme [Parasedimentitalea maritima]|uniref:Pre (Mob) type recombination enzyme n=1 Tax=Parasedimentitalea maritima TaxID=2578117 RepID=A0ABY2USI7_9RHOB|nr:Pre (Mob) type recombination enzyme [Zongyanglinia marina]TLP61351.1 Pre (Mob) type recombination enzyme [Zongyanglinia marina]
MSTDITSKKYPVVLRFEGLWRHQLACYEMHRKRTGGDLGHVDQGCIHPYKRLIGEEDWARKAQAEVAQMRAENFADELDGLTRRKRKSDIRRRMVEGLKEPWRNSKHGPMREVILTAHKDWFEDDIDGFLGLTSREEQFEEHAVSWLKETFSDDVVHARADREETTYHVHAVILPRTVSGEGSATRRMLQPSKHEVIKDYEVAQDSVGKWFAGLELTRGENRAAKIREARSKGETPPPKKRHSRTQEWRAEQELKIKADREALELQEQKVVSREEDADAILAVADGLSSGLIKLDEVDGAVQFKQTEAGKHSPDSPGLADRIRKSKGGVERARRAFGRAWRRTTERADARALAEAKAKLVKEYEEIRAADTAIVNITDMLPYRLVRQIVKARKSLTKSILELKRSRGLSSGDPKANLRNEDPAEK